MKKFIKNNLKLMIGLIIGAILAGGIVYAATSAKAVSYTTAKNTNIKNVEEALNDLYDKPKLHIYESGEFSQYVKSGANYVELQIDLSKTYTKEDNAKLIITDITKPNVIYYSSAAITDKIIGNSIYIVLLNFAGNSSFDKTYNVKYSIVKFDN